MKKLMAWNGFYGFEPFEIFIAYGKTLEEKKNIMKNLVINVGLKNNF